MADYYIHTGYCVKHTADEESAKMMAEIALENELISYEERHGKEVSRRVYISLRKSLGLMMNELVACKNSGCFWFPGEHSEKINSICIEKQC